MPMSFNALIVEKDEAGNTAAEVRSIDESRLPEADVTVAVEYSTVNYKDGLCLTGGGGLALAGLALAVWRPDGTLAA